MENRKYKYADHYTAAAFRNRVAIRCYNVMCIILVIAYFAEYLKGTRSIPSYLVIVFGCAATAVSAIILYRKKKDAKAVRFIFAFGFPLIYAYISFTSTTNLVFCYILLVIVLMILYSDIKISFILCFMSCIINVVRTILQFVNGELQGTRLTEAEIVIACVLLVGFFALSVSDAIQKINADRFDSMEEESKKTSDLLQITFAVSKSIIENVELVAAEMNKLDTSIMATKSSMEDVVAGVNETTDSVQTQQIKTEEIGTHIDEVEKITGIITEDVANAEDLVTSGKEIMDNLIEQVNNSQEVSKLVAGEMETLQENANNMQNILSLINSVATQTGLLALNASIEAARAGEAGKGFAVVAGEISNLANQTKEATGNIGNLIGNIESSLTEVANSVGNLIKSNEMQGEFVEQTADNFEKIHDNANSIYAQSSELADMVGKLATANDAIVESIQNISAISEEMTARANETLESSQADAKSVGNVVNVVESLSASAKELEEKTKMKHSVEEVESV